MRRRINQAAGSSTCPCVGQLGRPPRHFCWAGVSSTSKCLWARLRHASLSLLEEECGLAAALAKIDTSSKGSFSPEMLSSRPQDGSGEWASLGSSDEFRGCNKKGLETFSSPVSWLYLFSRTRCTASWQELRSKSGVVASHFCPGLFQTPTSLLLNLVPGFTLCQQCKLNLFPASM